jgi:hypothetical protein
LLLQSGLNLTLSCESSGVFLLYSLTLLLWLGDLLSCLLLTSSAQVLSIMCFIPLTERSRINLNNGGFGKGVGSDEFVIGRMESDDDHTDLSGNTLRTPREVTCFEAESTVFAVATTCPDEMDSLCADTSIGRLSAGFEGALLPCK